MLKSALVFLALVSSLTAFAHGEDVPGPHGGAIQMPGNFHTELISENKGKSFKVYLLDIQFKNPLTKNSNVKVQITENKKSTDLKCSAQKDHFVCENSKNLQTGSLVIKATRDNVVASMDASYALPLTQKAPAEPKMDHSKHH